MIEVIPGHVKYLSRLFDRQVADALLDELDDAHEWRRRHPFFDMHYGQPARCTLTMMPGSDRFIVNNRSSDCLWSDAMIRIKTTIDPLLSRSFNSVLINYYRDGRDEMGLHNDTEAEIGDDPTIACVSLGATRRFALVRNDDASIRHHVDLEHGSLVVMCGACQKTWRHGLLSDPDVVDRRISLTFREIKFMSP